MLMGNLEIQTWNFSFIKSCTYAAYEASWFVEQKDFENLIFDTVDDYCDSDGDLIITEFL